MIKLIYQPPAFGLKSSYRIDIFDWCIGAKKSKCDAFLFAIKSLLFLPFHIRRFRKRWARN